MEAGSEGAECRARGRDAESELPLFSYMLRVTYDGTDFLGWQMQAGSAKATVQETLEKALCTALQTPREVLKLQVTLLTFMCGVFCRVLRCCALASAKTCFCVHGCMIREVRYTSFVLVASLANRAQMSTCDAVVAQACEAPPNTARAVVQGHLPLYESYYDVQLV